MENGLFVVHCRAMKGATFGLILVSMCLLGVALACNERASDCTRHASEFVDAVIANGKDRTVTSVQSHYKKSEDVCVVLVEYREALVYGSWSKNVLLRDVYNDKEYGRFSEAHLESSYDLGTVKVEPSVKVIKCSVSNLKCQNRSEFDELIKDYFAD